MATPGISFKNCGWQKKDSKQANLCIWVSVTGLFGISVVFYFCACVKRFTTTTKKNHSCLIPNSVPHTPMLVLTLFGKKLCGRFPNSKTWDRPWGRAPGTQENYFQETRVPLWKCKASGQAHLCAKIAEEYLTPINSGRVLTNQPEMPKTRKKVI